MNKITIRKLLNKTYISHKYNRQYGTLAPTKGLRYRLQGQPKVGVEMQIWIFYPRQKFDN